MREPYDRCAMRGAEGMKNLVKSLKEPQRLAIDFGEVLQLNEVQPAFT